MGLLRYHKQRRSKGDGTVFKVTPSGTFTTLQSFCSRSGCPDGDFPQTGLVQATDGNFYGTTILVGTYGNGTIFKMTHAGSLATLYNVCSLRVDALTAITCTRD